jgi:hypothetical protein
VGQGCRFCHGFVSGLWQSFSSKLPIATILEFPTFPLENNTFNAIVHTIQWQFYLPLNNATLMLRRSGAVS